MPVCVTDTHPLLWYARGQHFRLSSKALRLFKEADQGRGLIYVPAAVLWEIAGLLKSNQLRLREPFGQWAASLLARRGFDLVPLDLEVIVEAESLALIADPFDAAIVATARVKDLPLITKDRRITEALVVEIAW